MHSTRGLIRNNLHVPCSVFPLGDFVTLLVGASKIKAHIYLSIWVHPHRFDKSVPFLSVVHDRCNILPRKDQCHYLQLVYKMLLLGTPLSICRVLVPKEVVGKQSHILTKTGKKKKTDAKQFQKNISRGYSSGTLVGTIPKQSFFYNPVFQDVLVVLDILTPYHQSSGKIKSTSSKQFICHTIHMHQSATKVLSDSPRLLEKPVRLVCINYQLSDRQSTFAKKK